MTTACVTTRTGGSVLVTNTVRAAGGITTYDVSNDVRAADGVSLYTIFGESVVVPVSTMGKHIHTVTATDHTHAVAAYIRKHDA